jgi:hypothetical protein
MKENNEVVPVEVFSGTIWQAELVKSMIEDASIDAYLIDENTGTLAPWYTSGGGAGAVKVVVSNLDEKEAKEIVAEYERNINSEKDESQEN